MQEKDKIIIEAAIKLFATKGYSSTSIQEIATESDISKGAFYLHFKSKDDLLLAILEYIFNTVNAHLTLYEHKGLSPRKKFIKQLSSAFETFIEHKEFFIMLTKEQAIPRNEEIKKLFFQKHFENHQFFRKGLVSIYGTDIMPHSTDLAFILEGLFHNYLRLVTFEQLASIEELTEYLMRRMDSIVKEIVFDQPFLTEEKLETIKNKSLNRIESKNISHVIQQMKNEIEHIENKEALEISIEVLEEEINKQNPRLPVIKGMLSNFLGIKVLEPYQREIASFYGLE